MVPAQQSPLSDLQGHIHMLSRIYTFLGWLGLIGSAVLLLAYFTAGTVPHLPHQTSLYGLSPHLSILLLICWSILLLNFGRDILGARRWSTGIGGAIVAIIQLFSVPVGTAVGIYTLWILFRYHRLQEHGGAGSL